MTDSAPEPVAAERLLLFRLGGRVYGTALETVREIVPWRRGTRLPGAPAYVAGLINLRGMILTVADLGLRLGVPTGERADGSIILIQTDSKTMGFIVDEVMDVRAIEADRIEPASAGAVSEAAAAVVRGMGHLDDAVVILVDLEALARTILVQ